MPTRMRTGTISVYFLILLAASALFTTVSCVTTVTPVKPETAADPEAEYRVKGLDLAEGSLPEMALDLYNANVVRFPKASEEIREKYIERQMAFFNTYMNERNIKRLTLVYANLRALGSSDAVMDIQVKALVRDELKAKKQSSTMLAMQFDNSSFDSGVKRSALLPLPEYEKIACHVIVHWTRKTVDKITRTDAPYFTGSGFFIDPTHIVTAYHVIEPVFDSSTVSWDVEIKKNGIVYKVEKPIACDPIDDIAVLTIKERMTVPGDIIGLFGDSSALTPGFDIYCLGDPQGFEMTWTRGIVSAVSRRAPELGRWVQMDAAVSGGASGGLVLGVDGKIYGMVVAGSFYGNINFAVPSRTLLARIDGLLAGESYRPPWLGILFEDDFEETGKLVINEVFPSSWLKSTGLKTGDVILEVNGIPVASPPDAQAIVSSLPVGSIVKVKATSAKEGKNVEYYAQLSGRPEYALYSASQTYDKLAVLYTYFGFRISEKETDVSTVTISGRTYTVKVYEVREIKPKSILDRYGVKVGDAVGVLSDYTLGMRRYFDLIHLPKGKKIFENIADFIIELMEGAYDENIL